MTYVLGPAGQIPVGEGRAFAVGGEQIAVFRLRDGGLRAVQAVCPHRGGPLADGQIDDGVVICPLHAHAFDLADGHCATGAPPVRTYPVFEEDGRLMVGN
ncbi:Rieske (2Fe-2S) protein [Actinomadura scrupuli]|uniref:Rieske (2Fe-2S) protein n=1 Tax=Actinomadura scrupuli TaxID=559629 RepID=UPI003D95F762